jgi:hypothetical protein
MNGDGPIKEQDLAQQLLDSFSPFEWRLIGLMTKNMPRSSRIISLADLAGHWFFDQPIVGRGLTIPERPDISDDTLDLLSALWPHANIEIVFGPEDRFPPQPDHRIKNMAQFAVNGLLWEACFPKSFPRREMHAYLTAETFAALSDDEARSWLSEDIAYETSLGPFMCHRFHRFAFQYRSPDCVRIGAELTESELKAVLATLPRNKAAASPTSVQR